MTSRTLVSETRRLSFFLLVATLTAAALAATAQVVEAQGSRFLRQPDVSTTHITFVHANDVWVVDRNGGAAVRLTSSEGAETDPHFSPDGRWIAFSGQYGGNTDVFVIPAMGGQPERLTWHPGADVVQGWTPDGDVLFRSGRQAHPTQLWKFFVVPVTGGMPAPMGAQAYEGEMNADGSWLAFQEIGLWDPEWRNHRGGQ
ncbi:MAG TPA: protease, partial [Gemmatimonadetes bacterium]|nr:protease [Gemmatimonadota bacterium]